MRQKARLEPELSKKRIHGEARSEHSDGSRSRTVADVSQTLGMPKTPVMESLIRLRTAGKVRMHGENWGLI
jgi:hypothetical protein